MRVPVAPSSARAQPLLRALLLRHQRHAPQAAVAAIVAAARYFPVAVVVAPLEDHQPLPRPLRTFRLLLVAADVRTEASFIFR